MQLNLNCLVCNLKQVLAVTDFVKTNRSSKEQIMREVLGYLHSTDYNRCNPEVVKGTWEIITKYIENADPYKEIKRYYNREILNTADKIRGLIEEAEDKFDMALKIAITGNLIDFMASHTFDEKVLMERIGRASELHMPVNHSKSLYEKLKSANTLLYLGDNCGEIVLDKIFIEYIKKEFPKIKVYFGVRGKPIVNDVTVEDAKMVNLEEVAEVISNGDGSLGTVIQKASAEFRTVFYNSDVIISKGQGNFESLSEIDRNNIFFLFMAKCDAVAGLLQVANLSIVCAEYHVAANKNNFKLDN